jgi:hypothetical protein
MASTCEGLAGRATTASKGPGDGVRNRIDCVGGPLRQTRTAGQAHPGIGRVLPRLTGRILRAAGAAASLTFTD